MTIKRASVSAENLFSHIIRGLRCSTLRLISFSIVCLHLFHAICCTIKQIEWAYHAESRLSTNDQTFAGTFEEAYELLTLLVDVGGAEEGNVFNVQVYFNVETYLTRVYTFFIVLKTFFPEYFYLRILTYLDSSYCSCLQ